MSRIPEAELRRLKAEVPLERLCARYGIELKRTGRNLVGRSPFREESEPSFVVTPEKNLWNDMGAGGQGGDTIKLVMLAEKASFRRACEILREMLGQVPAAPKVRTHLGTEHPVLVGKAPADHELMRHVCDFYHAAFCNDPGAMGYLQKRCCFHPEAAKLFRLGYANRTLGYRVPQTTAEGRALKAQLQRLGVLRASGHEHLNGSVVVPIFDERGNVAQMYGRKIVRNLRPGTPDHLYLPGELRGVFNAEALAHQKEILLCESLLDALTLWSAGLRNVTTIYGTKNFTPDLWAFFERVRPARVVLCFDHDAAGEEAAGKYAPRLAELGAEVLRAKLPPGRDINDVARSSARDPAAALAACIERAEPIAGAHASSPSSLAAPLPSAAEGMAAKGKEVCEGGPMCPCEPPSSLAASDPHPVNPVHPVQTPAPSAPPREASATDEHVFAFGERSWRVRGLAKNLSFETMKVQLRAMRKCPSGQDRFHLDTLDMCNAKHRAGFVAQAAEETGLGADILKSDIGAVLLRLEELQEANIRRAVEPARKEVSISGEEREAALELLRDPKLLDRILADFEKCGTVGEETNKLLAYLAAVSRKLDEPLAIIIQSTSAAGKTALMDAVLALMPEGERVKYSAMTGQSLFYLGDMNLKHKILAIVEEEGALKASYALKLLQSEGELTIASTGKDPNTGRMVTQEYRVEGPVMIVMTTTSIEISEELQNRCIVLTVDESREQTRAIHRVQRERYTLEGLLAKRERDTIRQTHQNAQRLLRPLGVLNPFARQLTFLDDKTRTRRDHEKYLTLIAAIALLHQYQRPIKTREHGGRTVEYIEASLDDVAVANRLAAEALGRSLDELPPQTRRFLDLLTEMVEREAEARKIGREDHRFTQRDARAFTGWSDFQVKMHLRKLADLEYVLVHRGGRGQSFVYELLYDGQGQDGRKFMLGLIDTSSLYDQNREHPNVDREHEKGNREHPGSAQVAPREHGGSIAENGATPGVNATCEGSGLRAAKFAPAEAP